MRLSAALAALFIGGVVVLSAPPPKTQTLLVICSNFDSQTNTCVNEQGIRLPVEEAIKENHLTCKSGVLAKEKGSVYCADPVRE